MGNFNHGPSSGKMHSCVDADRRPCRGCGQAAVSLKIGGMTTSHGNPTNHRLHVQATRRRRLVAPLLVTTLALGGAGALFGGTTGPGPVGAGTGHDEVAIPGVRGTGGGGGTYGVSTSPGRTELALPRKAGGLTPEYL